MTLTWLAEPTVDALRAALRRVAPDLAEGTIVPRGPLAEDDPEWSGATAVIDDRYVVKFAWAEPPARRISREARLLDALRTALPLPTVVAFAEDPAMLITRRSSAVPFFAVRHRITARARPQVARDLATVLAGLHGSARLGTVSGPPPTAEPTDVLRTRFGALVDPDRRNRVRSWCDWADQVLDTPGRTVLVHGDFHGDNHLWDPGTLRLRLVVDLETAGPGEPEFDLRCLPGDGGIELLTATVREYERLTGTPLDLDRIMAWHLRTVLGDARWRAEAGVPLPDHRTPAQRVDDLEARFVASDRVPQSG
ncbi:phosphotransferase family protein [Actinoplanes sp. NPDC049265]|uniref:phosphotransferase family protein n=1 Tax=Actinoplanes sp. NPDC049265 TaxID=3363902 RepID=UPI00371E8687